MGRKHREKRAAKKQLGWHENEFGELVHRTTKAEAREMASTLIVNQNALFAARFDLVRKLQRQVVENIQAAEDKRILDEIDTFITLHEVHDT